MLNEKCTYILIGIGVCIFLAAPFFYIWKEPILDASVPINKEAFGQFGDFITGVVGSIWALAGVILFYIALKEQRKDIQINRDALEKQIEALQLQSKEFSFQTKELEASRKIYTTQSKILKKQQFESTFFALLNVYTDITRDLYSTQKFFENNVDSLCQRFQVNEDNENDPQTLHTASIEVYEDIYFQDKNSFAHYFRSLYRIVRFIEDSSSLTDKEQFFYAKIVRSQLREQELLMLFYNAHTVYGRNFQPFILKYNLLKHLPPTLKVMYKKYLTPDHKNILLFHNWFVQMLAVCINQGKKEKYKLFEGEVINISQNHPALNSIFELTMIDLNQISLKVHLSDDYDFRFHDYFNYSIQTFSLFLNFLIYDIMAISRFEDAKFNTEVKINDYELSYLIISDNSINITMDQN